MHDKYLIFPTATESLPVWFFANTRQMSNTDLSLKITTFRYRLGEIGLMSWSPKLAFDSKSGRHEPQPLPQSETLHSESPQAADGYFFANVESGNFRIGCGQCGSVF